MKKKPTVAGFSERLHRARTKPYQEEDITHARIAEKLGLSREAVTKWEGKAEPAIKPSNLFALCDFLHVRPRWLAINDGPMPAVVPDKVMMLAEDCAALPPPFLDAVRAFVDGQLALLQTIPQLRRPSPSDTKVEQAGFTPQNNDHPPTPTHQAKPKKHKPTKHFIRERAAPHSPHRLRSVDSGKKKP